MSFEDKVAELEELLDKLEQDELNEEQTTKLLARAEQLKKECAAMLSEEKNEIIRVAKENNIGLEELDL